jgi:hypothetical protein
MDPTDLPPPTQALIETCRLESLALLERNLSRHGILAASRTEAAEARRYTRIFGRDAAICVLAMCGSGVPRLEQGAVTAWTRWRRRRRQRADPQVRRPRGPRRRLLVPGLHRRHAVVADRRRPRAPAGPGRARALARRESRAFGWLLAQEHQTFRLLQQNEASDWADIMPRSGYVLYTNALWVDVKRRYALARSTRRTTTSTTCSTPSSPTCPSTTARGCCATTRDAAGATPACT